MTQGRKRILKQTCDRNLDLERMQHEKDKGNITKKRDYLNKENKDIGFIEE